MSSMKPLYFLTKALSASCDSAVSNLSFHWIDWTLCKPFLFPSLWKKETILTMLVILSTQYSNCFIWRVFFSSLLFIGWVFGPLFALPLLDHIAFYDEHLNHNRFFVFIFHSNDARVCVRVRVYAFWCRFTVMLLFIQLLLRGNVFVSNLWKFSQQIILFCSDFEKKCDLWRFQWKKERKKEKLYRNSDAKMHLQMAESERESSCVYDKDKQTKKCK